MLRIQKIQRANIGEHDQLTFLQFRNTFGEIVDGSERGPLPFVNECLGGSFPQSAHVAQTQAQARRWELTERPYRYRTEPIGFGDVDRQDVQAMTLSILD